MPPERYIYYALLLAAALLCYHKAKTDKRLMFVFWLFAVAVLTESLGDYFKDALPGLRYLPYHFYIPIEYMLATFYISSQVSFSNLRKTMRWSIPAFIIISMITSFAKGSPILLPAIQYNLCGLLLIIWSVIALFNIPVETNGRGIINFPVFWISSGFLFLYTGQFFMNGFYNYLFSRIDRDSLQQLVFIVYYILNYLFYTLIIIGFLCMKTSKKYM